jgi:hypothetical protein
LKALNQKKLKSAVFHASTRMMSIGNQKSPLQNSFSEEWTTCTFSVVSSQESEWSCIYVLMVLILPTFYDFSVGLWTCDIFCFILLVHKNE